MRNKSLIFLFALIFMIVFSLSAVSADDLQGTDSGTVSGDVDVATANPWTTSGELTYDIPAEAKEVKSADLYVNVYAGSAQNTYGANANVSIKTTEGENQIASEQLWIEDGSTDGTIYTVNDHVNKCYSDYQMYYDLTDTFKGLNGSSVTVKVDTFKMENKEFDGRIKLIALVLAYGDGDNDTINYWVDSTQKWTKTNVTTTFATEVAYNITKADLINIALSSADGSFKLNGEFLGDADNHTSGNYYQYNHWTVTDKIKEGYSTELLSSTAGTSTYGSLKNVLTVLKMHSNAITADVSLATEYSNTCYAGTNNVITIKTKADKAANYTVELLADGKVINSTVVALDGENETTISLTDPTIRPIDPTTVSGANNNKVTYAVNVKYETGIVGSTSSVVPVLYNGYLGKDMEFASMYIEDITTIQVTGEVGFMVQNDTTYADAKSTNRTDEWLVLLDENSTFANAFVYLAYNWDKSGATGPVFNLTFNGQNITPKAHYRDQSNMGTSGRYGYGLFIYDVTDLMKNGINTLVLNKPSGLTAFYPSNLIYLYDTKGSDHVTTVYLADGVDLLSNSYNKAGRTVKTDSNIPINPQYLIDASLCVFAASAQKGEGNLIINGDENIDVWNGSSNSLNYYGTFLDNVSDVNNVSFVATGSTILALNQMIVTVKEIVSAEATLATEYSNTCYAGTNNTITITAKADKAANYTIFLLADDMYVNETVVALDGENQKTLVLTDPTIRPVDETTVNGADNKKVNYTVLVCYGDYVAGNASNVVPVLYDGYLGKDFAYNATFIEDFDVIQVTGDFVFDNKNDSTYMAAGATNRTDVWDISIGDYILDTALIYIPYNWDKTPGVDGPEFNVTFNGQKITPKAHYRDQSNLGSYGVYGYGMFVYDVSDLAKNGTNTLTINKPAGLTAVYPSNLIYGYNATGSKFMRTAYMLDGADLLYAKKYNLAQRVVKTDSQAYVENANVLRSGVLIYAASAQKGEGNIVINGVEEVDAWYGTTYSLDYIYFALDNVSDVNNISFVATGDTILALNQIILTTKEIVTAEASFVTEYTTATCYAGTNNTLNITVQADKATNYTVLLLADDVVVNSTVVALDGENKSSFLLTDPTVRPIDEKTVNGANNTKVTYAVIIKYGEEIVGGASKEVPLLYDGYLGKDFAYNATFIEGFDVIQVTGDIVGDEQNASTYMAAGATNRTDVWTIDLDENSTLTDALIYIPYNWDKTPGVDGPELNVTFNGQKITPMAHYRDQSNLGSSGRYGYGMFVYDGSDLIKNGTNTLTINKPAGLTAVYPSNLIYAYNTTGSKILKTAYIVEGVDLLFGNKYNLAQRVVKTDSQIYIDNENVLDKVLIVYAAGAQEGEGNIVINGVEKVDVWNGTSYTLDYIIFDLSNVPSDEVNNISFVATGSTIVALNQLILTFKEIIEAEVKLTTEYTDTCYAGTENVITIDVKADKAANYTVELLADGEVVDSDVVALDGENSTSIKLVDPTVRPIDETTVSGANNTKVIYTAYIKYGNEIIGEISKEVPVLYNGYFSKDMEYNATYIEDITVIQFTGIAESEIQNVSTYMAMGATNRTDVWTMDLGNDTSLVKAFIYLAYNWDKSGANGPVFNVTFNGKAITHKAHYRDQSNLGSSGKYGYGLFVFDVTDLVQDGNNTLVLNKPTGLTAVYPSNLIYFTNDTSSKLVKTAYLADGADLLYASKYNDAGRLVITDSQIAVDTKDVGLAALNVFAASAQKGEGDIIVNSDLYDDVWSGTSNSLECVVFDITGGISDLNNISFVSTGATILALNQIILVAPKTVSAEFKNMVVDGTPSIGATLVDANGNPVANETITYKVNGVENTTTTNDKGEFVIQAASNSIVEIFYAGNGVVNPVNATIELKDLASARAASVIKAQDFTQYAVDFKAGERGGYFNVQLVDVNGNPLANKAVKIGFNGVVYDRTTNETGWTRLQINLANANEVTFAVAFLGDDDYNGSFVVQKITINKKKTSISASAKSFKASDKTKKYTVTLKTDKGSSVDGKVYLSAGKKLTITVNGKTYTAKTNAKGQATFKLSITKKGKYSSTVKFAGDNTYLAASKSVKITIK